MRNSVEIQIDLIRDKVKVYFENNGYRYIDINQISRDDVNHIINIATSIMCTKYEIGYPGGSFVQSIVDNDLSASFACADQINLKAIHFYVMMVNNLSIY